MPHETTTESPKPIPPGAPAPADANGGVAAPPEQYEALIRRAKDIIGGRRPPEPLILSPWVTDFLDHERKHGQLAEVEPTEEAMRFLTNCLNLQAHYGGSAILIHTTAQDVITVLAVGREEIGAVLSRLDPEESTRVVIDYPDPPVGFDEPPTAGNLPRSHPRRTDESP